MFLPNSYVEIPASDVMVLGGGVLGSRLEHEGGAFVNSISVHTHRTPLPLLSCEDTAKGQLSRNQYADPHQSLNLPRTQS